MKALYGKGTALTNKEAVQRKAKCKMTGFPLMQALVDVAKKKGAKAREKAYWNIYHCQRLLFTSKGRMHAPTARTGVALRQPK